MLEKTIDNILDIFFSKDRTKLYVLLLFVFGFIIRIIAAKNGGLSADDAGHALRAVGSIESGKIEEYGQSSILWYFIQESFMKIFGASQLGSRLGSVFFGSFFIILAYLFVMQVSKSKKAAIIASTLAAFSPWFVKMSLPEMDIGATFFILFSALFLFKFIVDFKNKNLIMSSVLMGLAVMIKVYSLFFAFSFIITLLFYCYKNKGTGFALKKLIIFSIVLLIFCMPTLVHNYLLYKDKGIVDYMATNFLKIGAEKSAQYYSWAPGWNTPTDYSGFFFGSQKTYLGNGKNIVTNSMPGFIVLLEQFLANDPLIIIFGFIGIVILLMRKEKRYPIFFFICITIPFIFLGAHISMIKHQTYMPVFLITPAAIILSACHDKLFKKNQRLKLRYILAIIILFNLIWLGIGKPLTSWDSIYEKSSDSKLIDEKISKIDKDSFVIADSRIFRGILYWEFHDRVFIESSLFGTALEEAKKYNSTTTANLYFVECAIDDCGWGTIKDQPDFNKSMETIVSWADENLEKISEVSGPDYSRGFYLPFISEKENITRYRIYKTTLTLPSAIFPIAKSTHNYILYPIGYDRTFGNMFDDYKTHSSLDALLNRLSWLLLYISMVAALVFGFMVLYLFIEREK